MAITRRLALVLCISLAAVCAFGAQSALAVDAAMTGTVTDAAAGTPTGVESVCVTAWTIGPSDVREQADFTVTDADGDYTLTVPSGEYKLQFEDCGTDAGDYVTQWLNGKASYNSADPIMVAAAGATVNVALHHGGSISGTVTGPGSTPLEHICASADAASGAGSSGSDETNASGHYQLTSLRPGHYKVSFEECGTGNALPEYYNDRTGRSSGDAVRVTAESDTPDIDAQLTQGGSITGHVTKASDGSNMSGICVS